jgi:hypothetical protein
MKNALSEIRDPNRSIILLYNISFEKYKKQKTKNKKQTKKN